MSLIECPKCKKQVSELAEKCVSCGYAIPPVADMLRPKPSKTQTAKATGNLLGFLQFLGIIIMIIGVISFISVDEPTYSPCVVLVGVGIFLLARIGAWLKDG